MQINHIIGFPLHFLTILENNLHKTQGGGGGGGGRRGAGGGGGGGWGGWG
jgi:hypothetical protein